MTRPARVWRRLAVGLTAAALLCLCGSGDQLVVRPATQSAAAAPADGASFVLRAKAVYPVTVEQPGPLADGMVVVRCGRIVAVGRNLAVPPDLPLIELRDEVICPGFVSAGGSLVRPHAGPQSVSAAFHAVDAFDTYDDYAGPLSRGTTTAYLSPGEHRLVSGLGAVVKLGGAPEERAVVPAADLAVTFGEFDPPLLYKPPFYASSDVPIEPARGQRPDSRLGQFIELEERIAAAEQGTGARAGEFDIHAHAFAAAWSAALPLRIQVRRAVDIEGAVRLVERLARGGQRRSAYLVGLTEGDRLLDVLGDDSVAAALRGLPLVVRIERSFRAPGSDIGDDPGALEPRLATAERIAAQPPALLALAGAAGDGAEDLRMAAVLAVRGGLSPEQALAGITRMPAEILRVAERVGSLAPGRDADLLVLSGAPLDINSFVRRAYIGGRVVFEAPRPVRREPPASQPAEPLVLRAGTIWVGDGTIIRDGSLLIEDGRIRAVGQRVPHPPFARIIDAGADGFLAPGFIDALGHLGLEGDATPATPDVPLHRTIATAGRMFARVARAGVTTVVQAPYRAAQNGARLAALKTYGRGRDELVARELSGLRLSLRGQDPLTGAEALRKVLQAGRKYDEDWKKYESELAKWKESGGKPAEKPKEETEKVEQGKADPITGRWEYSLHGGPLPEAVTGTVTLKLTGNTIDGRLSDPTSGEEVRVSGTLSGTEVNLDVDIDTPVGRPTIRATLDREDHMVGRVSVAEISLDFEATRTDKSAVEFRIQLRSKRTKDGRPAPPKVDPNLEPYRALLAGRIPAVVDVETAPQIHAALKLFVDEFKVPLVLLGAEGAADVADELVARKAGLGVVVPPQVVRTRARRPYNQAADLARQGIRVALQSDSEDGARDLPLIGLFAVREGLGGDAALQALTIDAARMYKLDDRVGSLEPGKDADVLIFDGHPFDAGSRLQRVIVGGREVPDEP